jgi:hypothetical protein
MRFAQACQVIAMAALGDKGGALPAVLFLLLLEGGGPLLAAHPEPDLFLLHFDSALVERPGVGGAGVNARRGRWAAPNGSSVSAR